MTALLSKFSRWVKAEKSPAARFVKKFAWIILRPEWVMPNWYGKILGWVWFSVHTIFSELLRRLVYSPIFRSRLKVAGNNLYLYGGLPYTSGPLSISIGSDCRISGQTTFSGRSLSNEP